MDHLRIMAGPFTYVARPETAAALTCAAFRKAPPFAGNHLLTIVDGAESLPELGLTVP